MEDSFKNRLHLALIDLYNIKENSNKYSHEEAKEVAFLEENLDKEVQSVAKKMKRLADLLQDSPKSFILHIFDYIDYELGEETTKLNRESLNKTFDELYELGMR